MLREADPTATWEVCRFDGMPFLATPCGYFVEVAVTVAGVTLSQIHPILNAQNKPIAEPSAFDVNTSIQRGLVKAIALHGLGLYIYSGEDTPDEVVDTKTVTVTTATATAELKVPVAADQMDEETAKLFADGMLEYISVHRDLPDLNSYWKRNQTNLDKLKVSHPDLYDTVRNSFAEFKKTLQSKEQTK